MIKVTSFNVWPKQTLLQREEAMIFDSLGGDDYIVTILGSISPVPNILHVRVPS